MNFSFSAFAVLLLLVGHEASARNVATVTSTEGWSLTVALKYTGIQIVDPQDDCKWGFNYKIDMDYEITYSDGGGARMYYIGIGGGCYSDSGASQIPESSSRWGSISSPVKWSSTRTECNRIDHADYECRTVFLTVNGPGIPEQTVAMPYLEASAQQEILPVSLRDFTATSERNRVLLAWWTDAETNNSHFIVQRSANGSTWKPLAHVTGHGNTASVSDYAFEDATPLLGRAYYRLVQVDRDGTRSLSPVVTASNDKDSTLPSVYPDPAVDHLYVSGMGKIRLYDLSGRDLTAIVTITETALHSYTVDVSGLVRGVYVVRSGNNTRRFLHL